MSRFHDKFYRLPPLKPLYKILLTPHCIDFSGQPSDIKSGRIHKSYHKWSSLAGSHQVFYKRPKRSPAYELNSTSKISSQAVAIHPRKDTDRVSAAVKKSQGVTAQAAQQGKARRRCALQPQPCHGQYQPIYCPAGGNSSRLWSMRT